MNDQNQIKQIMSELASDDLWWGWHKELGWVVLDRTLPELTFYRCDNWETFSDKKDNWRPPMYVYAGNYLRTSDKDLFEIDIAHLQDLKKILPSKRENNAEKIRQNRFDTIEKLHSDYLANGGKVSRGIRVATRKNRVSHCWSCHRIVDNSEDYECKTCGWIVCSGCGACGCLRKN